MKLKSTLRLPGCRVRHLKTILAIKLHVLQSPTFKYCKGRTLRSLKILLRHQINNQILLCVRASSWTIFFNNNFVFSICGRQSPNQKDYLQKRWRSNIQINQDMYMYKVAIIFLINYHSDNLAANPTAVTSTLLVIPYSNSSIAIYQYCNFHHWTNIINLM